MIQNKTNKLEKAYLNVTALVLIGYTVYQLTVGFSFAYIAEALAYLMVSSLLLASVTYLLVGLAKNKLDKYFKITMYLLSLIVLAAGLIVMLGVVRDMVGSSCNGFFGTTMQCKDLAMITAGFLFYNWFSMPVIIFIALAGVYSQLSVGLKTNNTLKR